MYRPLCFPSVVGASRSPYFGVRAGYYFAGELMRALQLAKAPGLALEEGVHHTADETHHGEDAADDCAGRC